MDRSRVGSILKAIESALHEAEREQLGLSRRVEDVLGRAAVTVGNGTDEYLERESLDSYHQDLFGIEISNGQRRLNELSSSIKHFKFLKVALISRFPDVKGSSSWSRLCPLQGGKGTVCFERTCVDRRFGHRMDDERWDVRPAIRASGHFRLPDWVGLVPILRETSATDN
jgi:hypothetical protein